MIALLPGCPWFETIRASDEAKDAGGIEIPAATGCSIVPGLDDAEAPVIFFTDLVQGPNSAFLTLYGLRFGVKSADDRVLLGDTEVAAYVAWNERDDTARKLETITVQPGPEISGDDLPVVVIAKGRASNAVLFSAKTGGRIWFADSAYGGADSDGSKERPLRDLSSVKRGNVSGGDVVYLKGTFTALVLDAATHPLTTADAPVAYVGFPGEPATIGGSAHPLVLDDGGNGEGINHFVFANLIFTNALSLEGAGNDLRFAGNTLTDFPTPGAGMIELGDSSDVAVLGNRFRSSSLNAFHASGRLASADFAYNEIYDCDGGFSFDSGGQIASLRVFSNLFARVNFIDLSIGSGVASGLIFNNIFVNNASDTFSVEPAPVLIANNTLFDVVGGIRWEGSGAGGPAFRNNLLSLRDTLSDYTNMSAATAAADHNIYAPKSGGPSVVSSVETDGRVFTSVDALQLASLSVDPSDLDFTPLAASPLLDAGADTGLCADYFGRSRARGAAYDVGAIERP